jgi:uncharacterized cupin superfamily protein
MIIVRRDEVKKFKNNKACCGDQYEWKDEDINGALIEIRGRYPSKGRVVNTKCKELVYVLKGSGSLFLEDKEIRFSQGDMLLLYPGEKYFWQADCEILTVCAPGFYSKQHKKVA